MREAQETRQAQQDTGVALADPVGMEVFCNRLLSIT